MTKTPITLTLERKLWRILVILVKWCHSANGLFECQNIQTNFDNLVNGYYGQILSIYWWHVKMLWWVFLVLTLDSPNCVMFLWTHLEFSCIGSDHIPHAANLYFIQHNYHHLTLQIRWVHTRSLSALEFRCTWKALKVHCSALCFFCESWGWLIL